MGRFISEDPIGTWGGLNVYRYAAANPARFTDPSGLKVTMDVGTAATPPLLDRTCKGSPGATCPVENSLLSLSGCTERCDGWGFDATVRMRFQQQFSKDPGSPAPESPGMTLQQHEDLHVADLLHWFSEDEVNDAIQTEGFRSEPECELARGVFVVDLQIYEIQGWAWTAALRDPPR